MTNLAKSLPFKGQLTIPSPDVLQVTKTVVGGNATTMRRIVIERIPVLRQPSPLPGRRKPLLAALRRGALILSALVASVALTSAPATQNAKPASPQGATAEKRSSGWGAPSSSPAGARSKLATARGIKPSSPPISHETQKSLPEKRAPQGSLTADSDVGVLALPQRPSKRAASAPSRDDTAESAMEVLPPSQAPATFLAQDEARAAASPSKIIPAFYGDFAPARSSSLAPPGATPAQTVEQSLLGEGNQASRDSVKEAASTRAGSVRPALTATARGPSQGMVQRPATTFLSYDRTREVFLRLVPSAARFNTDYRTRPAGCEIPLTLCGRGLQGRNLPIGQEDAWRDRLPPDYMPTDLVLLPVEWCYANQPIYLRREAAESLVGMLSDAQRQGLRIQVVSGYRDYNHQERLYRQNGGRRGSRTVGRPGKSEHMLGTTVDVTSTEKYLLNPAFAKTPEGKWLAQNAHRYGWKLTVVSGSRVIEPWHFRYFGRALSQHASGGATSSAQAAPKRPEPLDSAKKPLRATGKLFGRILGK